MARKVGRFIYWAPRILSIILIVFLALMSLDVFSMGLGFPAVLFALLMHLIPALVLALVLIVSWRYEIVGGVAFILAGIFYIGNMVYNALSDKFEWYMLSWSIQFGGLAIFIGILFILNWKRK
jgi:hypothetical protein